MRLVSLEISGFRGFPQRHAFDLDADAVVVVGTNGHGKTSLFNGILWALSGRIPRLPDDARLVSMYSETGQARVELGLKNPATGSEFTVTRSFDGNQGRVSLETPEGSYQGPAAEGRLIDLLWPDAASASDPGEALASVLTRSVYLQQDLVRQFIEAASKHERFAAVSELVGAGRVTELQAALERDKKAWSTVTNQRQAELGPLRERLTVIESRLSELTARASEASPAIASEAWSQWWQSLSAHGISVVQVDPSSREAPPAIDNAIKQLDALRRSTKRRLQALQIAQTEIAGLANRPMPKITLFRDKVNGSRQQLEDLKRVVSEEQARLAELRHVQASLQEKTEQLKTRAALALRHLDDRCPVCAQTYDRDTTRLRLEALARGTGGDFQATSGPDKLTELLAALAAKEKEVATAELTLRSAEQTVSEGQKAAQTLTKRLTDIGVITNDNATRNTAVANEIAEADALIGQVIALQRVGESMALHLAQSSALAAIDDLRHQAESLRREYADREKLVAARNQTGELAQRVIEALREAASAVVEERVREIGPLLQSIYARIDPHPAFRLVTFLSSVFRGRGQLSTVISDPIAEKECDDPAAVLSSSQMNALAVSVFLALNIGVPKPPLSVAILDDPLQSLDDINLLAWWIYSGGLRTDVSCASRHMMVASAASFPESFVQATRRDAQSSSNSMVGVAKGLL
jgi:DNA repair protein SbcC/Rad50